MPSLAGDNARRPKRKKNRVQRTRFFFCAFAEPADRMDARVGYFLQIGCGFFDILQNLEKGLAFFALNVYIT